MLYVSVVTRRERNALDVLQNARQEEDRKTTQVAVDTHKAPERVQTVLDDVSEKRRQ